MEAGIADDDWTLWEIRGFIPYLNSCPHCNATTSPLRLMLMTRRAPYHCTQCGGRSLLKATHNTLAAVITIGVVFASIFCLQIFGVPAGIACFLGLYVFVVGGIMWLFMQLEPTKP